MTGGCFLEQEGKTAGVLVRWAGQTQKTPRLFSWREPTAQEIHEIGRAHV